ncbi:MAG: phosphate ABC transporter substrate-binding protein [Armatimonadetes bacterium]|nr:phosphate ABC transporter substrate-binding protein [Armatimonadota bacterium]
MMDRCKVNLWVVASLLAACAVLVMGCGRGPKAAQETRGAGAATTISQIGSTTVLPLAEQWRAKFNAEHPEIDIAVSGGGSGTGLKALIDGSANMANSSREIKQKEIDQAKEAGVNPVEHVVAYDGIAVIVHPSNPIAEISVAELSEVFSGQVTDWDRVGARGMGQIQVVSRDSASGTYESFKELVVTLGGKDESRDYAASALKQTSNQGVLALVGQTKSAIGYVGLGYVDESVKTIAVTPLEGQVSVSPTVENVKSGAYPISRALYIYTSGEPTGSVKTYLDWIQGPAGQAVVEDLGFVPVN